MNENLDFLKTLKLYFKAYTIPTHMQYFVFKVFILYVYPTYEAKRSAI